MEIQDFEVLPRGIICGGIFSYCLDPDRNQLNYHAEVDAKIIFTTKHFDFGGGFQVEAMQALSANFITGAKIELGPISLTVTSVGGDARAHCDVEVQGFRGIAILDLRQQYAWVFYAEVQGYARGEYISIALQPK